MSRDSGATWEWLSPGQIGPLVTAVLIDRSEGGGILIASPSAVHRGDMSGGGWRSLELPAVAMTHLQDGRVVIVDGSGSMAALEDEPVARVTRIGVIPGAVAVAEGALGAIWALAEGRLWSRDASGSWTAAMDLPGQVADLAGGVRGLAALLEDGRVALSADGSDWSISDPGIEAALIGASEDANIIAVCGDAGIAWTTNGGRTWATETFDCPASALAVAHDGSVLILGTMDGRVIVVDSLEGAGSPSAQEAAERPATGVVTEVAWDEVAIAAACPGATWRSAADDGTAWTPWAKARGWVDIAPLTADVTTGELAVIDGDRILGPRWSVDVPEGILARTFALATDARGRDLVVTDGQTIARWHDGADAWSALGRPDESEVVSVTLGCPGGHGEVSVVAGTASPNGLGAVWAWLGDRWILLASGDDAGARVRIASVAGARGVYAAVGSVLYRPAMMGAALLAPEDLPGGGGPILGLAASRGDGEDVVAALTSRAIHVSQDGGLGWTQLRLPDGPPGMALGMRARPALQVLVGLVGGELLAATLGRPG